MWNATQSVSPPQPHLLMGTRLCMCCFQTKQYDWRGHIYYADKVHLADVDVCLFSV